MSELFLAYAPRDRDAVEFVVEGLEKAGFVVLSGYDDLGEPRPAEDVALEIKRAAAFIPVLTAGSSAAYDLKSMMRAAFIYERPMVAARLEHAAETGVYAEDLDVVAATRYEDEPAALTDELERAVDLYDIGEETEIGFQAGSDASDAEPVAESGGGKRSGMFLRSSAGAVVNRDPQAVARLIAALKAKGVTPRARDASVARAREETPRDSRGLPKSAESMVTHWRMIREAGSVRDFENFATDYEDDPYFATMADEAAARLRRKRIQRGGYLALDAVFGMLIAGALFWGVTTYCQTSDCSPQSLFGAQQASVGGGGGGGTSFGGSGGGDAGLRRDLQEANARAQQLGRDLDRRTQEFNALTRDFDRINRENQELRRAQREASEALRRAEAQLASLRQQQAASGGSTQPPPRAEQGGQGQGDARLRRELEQTATELRRAQQQIASGQSRVRELETALATAERRLSDRDRQAQELQRRLEQAQAQARTGGGSGGGGASVGTGGLAGAERLLIYYRDRLQRVAQARGRPRLDEGDLRALQQCILLHTGQVARADGVWGLETTAALFGISSQQAGWVIDCLNGRN